MIRALLGWTAILRSTSAAVGAAAARSTNDKFREREFDLTSPGFPHVAGPLGFNCLHRASAELQNQ